MGRCFERRGLSKHFNLKFGRGEAVRRPRWTGPREKNGRPSLPRRDFVASQQIGGCQGHLRQLRGKLFWRQVCIYKFM